MAKLKQTIIIVSLLFFAQSTVNANDNIVFSKDEQETIYLIVSDDVRAFLHNGDAFYNYSTQNFTRSSIVEIQNAYNANAIRADRDYKGKYALFNRVIIYDMDTMMGEPYIRFVPDPLGPVAFFKKSQLNNLINLNKGDTVSITCKIDNNISTIIKLSNCDFLNNVVSTTASVVTSRIMKSYNEREITIGDALIGFMSRHGISLENFEQKLSDPKTERLFKEMFAPNGRKLDYKIIDGDTKPLPIMF